MRKTPPCSEIEREDNKPPNKTDEASNDIPYLCEIFNKMFTEENMRNIFEIMKFSISSPLPQSLEDMASYNWRNDENDYQVLFPNEGKISFLRTDE